MEFTLNFNMDNDAFNGDMKYYESSRILQDIAKKIKDRKEEGKIYDINGNQIGHWYISELPF